MGKIRIIGGYHRSRQLPVLDSLHLRPTLDRVKETLFNWLQQDLTGKRCLDLFAGSGSLGFEAISRNAQHVVMVEKERQVAAQLRKNQQLLAAANCQIINDDALNFLHKNELLFDVIFLDPPYHTDLLAQCLPCLAKSLALGGLIYIEYLNPPSLDLFTILKQGRAGKVNFALLTCKE